MNKDYSRNIYSKVLAIINLGENCRNRGSIKTKNIFHLCFKCPQ